MKKLLYLLIIAALMFSCKTKVKEPYYVIKGKIVGADSITFILQKRVSGKFVRLDSAVEVKGEFKIKGGSIIYPDKVYLSSKDKEESLVFYLENSDIIITGHIDSLENAKVTGSKTHDEFMAYQDLLKPFNERINKIYEDYEAATKAGDKAKVAEIEKNIAEINAERITFDKEFIKNHPASFIAPSILSSLSYELEADEIDTLINGLDTTVANAPKIKDLKARVVVMKTVAIGQKAPDFILNDVNDKPLPLSSKISKSKLLLIDFWASWCGPCRQENPNVVKIYKEYNKKGFDVFGVSLDENKEDWVKAIADDKLTWTQVSDLQYWNNAAAKLYAVRTIPANFLLDKTGTIIARNLRGDALKNKVKEVLGGK
jgi:peroxiredoxin